MVLQLLLHLLLRAIEGGNEGRVLIYRAGLVIPGEVHRRLAGPLLHCALLGLTSRQTAWDVKVRMWQEVGGLRMADGERKRVGRRWG
jgi:hypothetical protein